MARHLGLTTLLLASLAAMPVLSSAACAESSAASSSRHQTSATKQHRVVTVVTQVSEKGQMIKNLALDDAENLTKIHEQAGETVQIEIVAFGPGLNMVRSDTSPVRDRLTALVGRPQPITFPGRNNTLGTQSKQESKGIGLSPEAFLVSAGIGRVVELQERGGPVSVHR